MKTLKIVLLIPLVLMLAAVAMVGCICYMIYGAWMLGCEWSTKFLGWCTDL